MNELERSDSQGNAFEYIENEHNTIQNSAY